MSSAIITVQGLQKINAFENTGVPVNITHIALGDSGGQGYDPTGNETGLVNEVWRTNVATSQAEGLSRWYEIHLPPEVGGFWVREFGVFDNTGTLIAIGRLNAFFKMRSQGGDVMDVRLRVYMTVSNQAAIEVTMEPEGFLRTDNNLSDLTDVAAARENLGLNYGSTAGTVAQGNDSRLSDSREWTAELVSQSEAEAGENETPQKWSAQRVWQAFSAALNAISSVLGRTILKRDTAAEIRDDIGLGDAATFDVATSEQAQDITSNSVLMTPVRTRQTVNQIVFGAGQSWQNVQADRETGTDYTNATGKAILVNILFELKGTSTITINGRIHGYFTHRIIKSRANATVTEMETIQLFVPNGSYYNIETFGDCTVFAWREFR